MSVAGFIVNKTFNDTTLEEVLVYDLLDVSRLNAGVEGSVRMDDDDRSDGAESEASGADDLYFIGQTSLRELGLESFLYLVASGGSSSGTAADKYV